MNDPDPASRREELLARLLTGDLSPDDREVRHLMDTDPTFEAEVASLSDLAEELDRSTGLEAVRRAPEPWPGADRAMAELVQRELGPAASRPKAAPVRRPRRPWLWLALAAALLLGGLFLRSLGENPPVAPSDLPLTGLTAEELRMTPRVVTTREALARDGFGWTPPAPEMLDRYVLTLHLLAGPRVVPDLREPEWRPSADEVAGFPTAFDWSVERVRLGRTEPLGRTSLRIDR